MGRIGKRRGIGGKKKVDRMREMILREQLKAFKAKFGRDPLPHEPVFFDPDADEPVPLTEEKMMQDLSAAMGTAGLPPQIAYATEKTGLMLMEGMEDEYPPEAVAEWTAAIEEYFELEKAGKLPTKS